MISRNLYTKQQSEAKSGKKAGFVRALLLVGLMLFGVQAIAQNYTQAVNLSGSVTVNGIAVTVTSSGGVGSSASCGAVTNPYTLTAGGAGSYTFTFSAPVGSVKLSTVFGNTGLGNMHVVRNGSAYAITDGNLAGTVGTCSPGVLAVAASGDLTNTGNTGSFANNIVVIPGPITSLTVSTSSADAVNFGLAFTPGTYFQVTNTAGAAVVNGVTVTTTSSGNATTIGVCGQFVNPYFIGQANSVGQYNFGFSSAVDGINVLTMFSSSIGALSSTHYIINGSGITLTAANINGKVQSACTDNVAAVISGGDLTNTGDVSGNPTGNVMLNGAASTLTVSTPGGGNGAIFGVFFTKGSTAAMQFDNASPQSLNVCTSSGATSINSKLAATDLNAGGLTLTWSIIVNPLHGSLGGFPYTDVSTGASVTPSGLTYTPTGGYSGTDGFTIQVTDGVNTATTTINVSITPVPDVSNFSTTATNVCQGSGSVVTVNSTSLVAGTYAVTYNTVGANSFSGNIGSITIASNTGTFTTLSMPTAGATTVIITAIADACASTAPVAGNVAGFTVNPNPSAIFVPGAVCVGQTMSVTDGTTPGTFTSSNAGLASVGATVAGTATVTGVAAGNPTLTYTTASGCTTTALITVNPSPAAITGSNTVCTGSNTSLTETVAGGTWASSAPLVGSVSTAGVVTGITSGNLNITYTLPAGCFVTFPMTVNQTPPTMTGPASVCTGSTITLADGTGGGIFSSSSPANASVVAATGVVTGVAAGTPTLSYTVPNGCFVTQIVTVNTTPAAIAGATSVCVGFSTTLTDLTPSGTWTSSNTLLATVGGGTGIVTGVASGIPNITYTVPNGCYVLQAMSVNPNPAAIAGPTSVCTGTTITLTDATGSGTWSSSNAGLASVGAGTGVVTGNSTGVPNISYTLATGCYALLPVTVNQTPGASTGSSQVCVGQTTTLTNTTGGGTWSAQNANATVVSGTGVVTGVTAGADNISYIITATSCFTSFPLTINNNPAAIGGAPFAVCAGSSITLTDATVGGTWLSSNSAVATVGGGSGTVTGISSGVATISYTVGATGCFITQTVTVNVNPSAITGTTAICVGATSTLVSSPAGGTWTSSNLPVATVSPTGVVTGVSAGTSNISYTLATGCFAATTVTINPLPAAISGTAAVCVGSTTTLTDGGGGIWTSSNPAQASIGAGTGILAGIAPGNPTITYTLPTGCTATVVATVNPNPSAIAGTTNVCVGLTTALTDGTAGGSWTSSNSGIASVGGTGITTGVSAGTATITYTLPTSCIATTTITVNPLPAAIAGTLAVCTGATTALTDATGGGSWTSSDITKATVVSGTGVVTGVATGNPVISYTLATGCYATAILTVNQTPVGITGVTNVCVGLTTTLADATPSGTWSSSNTSLATAGAGTGVITGVAAGVPTITYTIAATGCFTVTPVTVNANPAAIGGTAVVCVGSTTLLTDATAGGTWTSSNALLATVGASTGIVTGVGAGNPVITYTLPTGCINTIIVTVNPLPAGISGTTSVCTGFTTALGDATPGGTWTSSNPALGAVSGTGVVTGVSAGTPIITYTLATGCIATTPVTVNTTPPAITGTTSVCVGSTTSLFDATSGGIWTSSNAGFATVGAGTGTVTGISAGTPNITYTVPTGCFVSTPVVVNPLPAGITGIMEICIGLTTTLADGTPSGTWSSSNPAQATVVAGSGLVTGVSAGTPTITYTLGTGCFTTTTVTIDPNPTAITGTGTVCTGFTTTLASTPGGGTWSSSNTALATVNAGTGVVTGVAAGTPSITYTLSTGCIVSTIVTVNQTPAPIAGTFNVCVGLTTTLTDATASGTWSSSAPSQASVVAGTGVVTGVAAGIPVISYVMATGCFVTQPVTVNANPAAITGPTTVCTGLTIGLSDATSAGTWSSSDVTKATIGAGSGVVTGVSAGAVTITYALSTGCLATYAITVNTTPAAITGITNVCTGFTTTLADATVGGTWSSSNSAQASVVGATGVVTGVSAGTPTLSYTMGTGCFVTTPVTVNQNPPATTGTASVCVGLTTVLSNTLAGGTWSSTNPAQATVGGGTGIVSGVSAGNPVISYTMATGCYTLTNLTVNPTPAAVTGPSVVCEGSNITMNDATAGGLWSSGNPAVATINVATGVVTGVAAGVVNITYTLGGGCTASTPITVNPVPNISNFTSTVATSQCVGLGATVTVSSTSLGVGSFVVTYNLSGANAVTGATATLTMGATNGTFAIPSGSLTVTGFTTVTITGISNGFGCTSVPLSNNTSTFSVYPLPTVYNVTGGGGYCVGGTGVHVFLSNSVGGINYQLWLGSTAVGAPVAGTFSGLDFGLLTTVGTYSVTATNATTGCSSNMFGTATIFTNPLPTAFTVTGGGSYCAGGTGVAVGLSNSTGGINYQLYIGGVASGSPVAGSGSAITFGLQTTAGVYTVVATNTATTCVNNMTGSATVTINPLPAAIAGTLFVCPGTTSTLTDATSGGTWTSTTTGVATIGSNTGVVTGVTAGTSIILYTLPTGCSISAVVTVNPLPASIAGASSLCVGSAITLTDATGGGTWNSSNTTLATVGISSGIVSGVNAGTPTITYTLATGCFATFPITVNPTPVAVTGATSVCVGLTTTLSDATAGGTWSSSLSGTASINAASGLVTGVAAGTVTITYTLAAGCNTTYPFTVNPSPAATTGTASVCVGATTTLADAVSGGSWSSSNVAIGTVASTTGVVGGIAAGTVTITYTLPAGCFTTTLVTVNPTPAAIAGTNNVCVGLTTTLTDATAGGTWSSSNTAFAGVGAATGVVTGASAGTVTITYTLAAGSCNATFPMTVNPLPAAITGVTNVCIGLTTTLADASAGGSWTSSNTLLATVVSGTGVVTGVAAGTPTITYTLPTGCINTTTVTVNPLPVAITGITTVCVGSTTTLSDASAGGTWVSSNTALATIGSSTGLVTGIGAGSPTITYTLPTGCLITQTITVYPSPAVISGSNTVCVGLTTTLTDAVSGGSWSSSNAGLASVGAGTGVVSGVAVGTPTITYTLPAPGSCFSTMTISVNPQPVAITGTGTVCEGATTTLSDATTGGTWSSANSATAVINSTSGIVTGVAAGTVTMSYTLPAGCFVTTIVTVFPTPAAITGTNNVCVGLTTALSDLSAGGTWTSSIPAQASIGSATGVVTGIAAGTPVITYTLPAGCTAVYAITVNPLPASITGTTTVCVGSNITLADATAGGSWSSSNTTVATVGASTGVVLGVTSGTTVYTYTLPTGCITTRTGTVNPLPTIYTLTGGGTYCAGGAGSSVGLSGSDIGTNYQLMNGGATVGTPVAGTGSAISFGALFTAATYTVIATNATSCSVAMTGTATITVSVLPTVFNMTGGGAYCAGSTGVAVGLTGSTSGVNYQLFNSITPIGAPVAGTGSAISFGILTGVGTYTVVATNATTGCVNNMAGASVILVNPLPTAFIVTGGGVSCAGTTGVHVGLSGSTAGVNYTLSPGSVTLPGTGGPLDFGLFTTAGTYTVSATNATTSCTNAMTGSVIITAGVAPLATFTLNATAGTNPYCAGGTGAVINLNNSQAGVNYQLFFGGSAASGLVAGTTSAITFGSQTAAGVYTVQGTNAITGCASTMTSTLTVSINALPRVFHIISPSGGSICSGSGGSLPITLDSSLVGVTYNLTLGGVTAQTRAGTGSALTFTASAAGVYTVIAVSSVTPTSCTSTMTGSATISIAPLPTVYILSISGTTTSYCPGSTGLNITLSNSDLGFKYQLYNGTTAVGAPVNGTASALTYGPLTAGSYSIVASNNATLCTSTMTGTVAISASPLPIVYNITGGGSYCLGGTGISLGLSNSQVGITYQLMNGLLPVTGGVRAGTGAALDFGPQTATGIYTVVATNSTTTCTNTMNGTSVINTSTLPVAANVTGGGAYCAGGTGVPVNIDASATNVNYQLLKGTTMIGLPVPGTGAALTFGNQLLAGVYTVVGTSTITGCSGNMTGSVTVSVNPAPVSTYSVTGGGGYCAGGAGALVGLSSSDTGISYRLYNTGLPVGLIVPGTGAAISFGAHFATGIRTVIATNNITGCTSTMTGSVTITINPVPDTFIVSGGGAYCPGGTGRTIGLGGSVTGINYQLYMAGSPVGGVVAGSGAAITFGLHTGVGTYSVQAINAATTCTSLMTGTAIISLSPLPAAFSVTGGGGYCVGSTGVNVILSGSTSGVNYTLYRGTASMGSMTGTGSAINFGLQTGLGTYTVIATSPVTTCSNTMTGSVVVSLNPLPSPYTVTGGGGYCAGGTGLTVGLSNSDVTISYQLYKDGLAFTPALAGTGSALNFGLQTASGSYTVKATNSVTSCINDMTGSATISINALPGIYLVSTVGSGTYCAGGAGVDVTLSTSDAGVNYQLKKDGVAVGGTVAGLGTTLDFGMQTAAGNYTVVATNPITSCTSNMAGSATVSVNPLPATYTVTVAGTGAGAYCAGGVGLPVILGGSTSGISYQLYNSGTSVGLPVTGTGVAVNFGLQTAAGTYTVVATNMSTTCTNTMTGSATITINPLPIIDTVTGGGNYCPGGVGNHIGLSSSTTGVNYQLFRGITPLAILAGTGSGLDFGLQSIVGTYFATATDPVTGCSINMAGAPSIGISPLPAAYNVMGSSTGYCIGGAGVDISLSGSDIGTQYQLYLDMVALGTPMSGTGFTIDFGLQASAGTYSIIGTNTTTTCVNNMTGTPAVVINPLPVQYTVTGGGGYCAGGTGVHVMQSGSDVGVSYELYNGTASVGSAMPGTSFSLDFGALTAGGIYTVIATSSSSCTSTMLSSATVAVNPLPTAYTVVGGGSYCSGTTGVHVGINFADSGVNYQLYAGTTPVGVVLPGANASLDFGAQTTAGVYTVIGTNPVTSCTGTMTGSTTVSINPLPATFTVTGGGNYCIGGTGVHVGISGSAIGINYQLKVGGSATGPVVAGTGAALDFGLQTAANTYTVDAANPATGCTVTMTGSTIITISTLPSVFNVTGGGSYCASTAGVLVGLDNSTLGVNYQLYNGTSTVGGLVAGTNTSLSFGVHPAGTYTVVAINATTTCSSNMAGSATVTVMPSVVPSVTVATGVGDTVCTGTAVTFSALVVNGGTTPAYAWSVNGSPVTGATSSSYTYVPANGNIVTVSMVSSATCPLPATATGSVTMTVRANVLPSVTIVSSPGTTVCQGTTVDFMATPVNGGSDPSYSWKVNGFPVSSGSTYTYIPADGDIIYAVMTSSYQCLTVNTVLSNNITIHVQSSVPPSVTIFLNSGANVGTALYNDTLTAVVTNVGPAPKYQWTINGVVVSGAVSSVLSIATLNDLDAITVEVTDSNACGYLVGTNNYTVHSSNVSVKPVTSAISDIRLVPNPNKGTFTIKGSLASTNNEDVTIEVTNVLGQVVYKNNVVAHNGNIDEKIQIANNMANGMYMVNVHSANESKVFHMVIEQ